MIKSGMLTGNKVRLGAINAEDIETIASWYEDADFLRFFDKIPANPKSKQELQQWIKDTQTSGKSYSFSIRPIDKDEMVGYIELSNIQWWNGVANLGIGIGEKKYRGGGFGKEAMELILTFAFNELNLHRVQLNVFSYNMGAMSLYEKLGFKREGVYREFIHRDGKRWDMYLYGILWNEWKKI
ncbi:GNAT family N-acetyltransferase [Candidatus Clostridium stratigraminis]|uniref:GNAT family N-acetyltransferase n=1 Tax=Candidatus Clostridium stratigraminis TaxID=3381661 RepID=A0ABW8SXZ1_9CLOT